MAIQCPSSSGASTVFVPSDPQPPALASSCRLAAFLTVTTFAARFPDRFLPSDHPNRRQLSLLTASAAHAAVVAAAGPPSSLPTTTPPLLPMAPPDPFVMSSHSNSITPSDMMRLRKHVAYSNGTVKTAHLSASCTTRASMLSSCTCPVPLEVGSSSLKPEGPRRRPYGTQFCSQWGEQRAAEQHSWG